MCVTAPLLGLLCTVVTLHVAIVALLHEVADRAWRLPRAHETDALAPQSFSCHLSVCSARTRDIASFFPPYKHTDV